MEDRAGPVEKLNDNRKLCHIDRKLLPFKFHYFFSYGSMAAVMPFLPIIAKQIGINAAALGVGYSVKAVFTLLSNPLIGLLVDFFQNIKVFIISLLIANAVAYASVLFLPPITHQTFDVTYIRVSRFNESEPLLNISKPFAKSCLENILQTNTNCKLAFTHEDETVLHSEERYLLNTVNVTHNANYIINLNQTKKNVHWTTFYIEDVFLFGREDIMSSLNVLCTPTIHHCSINEDNPDVFSTYQFWIFFILVIFASITTMSSSSLSSVACLEILGTNARAYGRQRLFGTIAWGVVCPLSGLLNEHFEKSFTSIIYLMAAFLTIDIIILCIIPLPKVHLSSNINRDLRIIFTSKEILFFSFGIAVIGFLSAIIHVFEFWFLEDMGANRTLIGLSLFMQCIVGEVPFLFFSGWFVDKLGHFICFTCVFLGFLLRLALYYLLNNPWLVLPVDTLHGVTYGLFHGAMASYAKERAPKGMEATLLGLFGGIYDGLGVGLGSFVGGFGLEKIGSRQTFFASSMLSLGCFVLFLIASHVFKTPSEETRFQPVSLKTEDADNDEEANDILLTIVSKSQ